MTVKLKNHNCCKWRMEETRGGRERERGKSTTPEKRRREKRRDERKEREGEAK